MLKIGIFGAGHLGKIHIQQWKEIEGIELVGFFDPNDENAASAIEQYQVKRFNSESELLEACTAVDIVTNTTTHYEIAKRSQKLKN
jgi:predicted dehydrogenase